MLETHILASCQKQPEFKSFYQSCAQGARPLGVGVPESLQAIIAANVYQQSSKPLLIIAPKMEKAIKWQQNLAALLPQAEVRIFPRLALLPFEVCAHNLEVAAERLQVMSDLANNKQIIAIAPVSSLVRKLVPKEVFLANNLTLENGMDIPMDTLCERLINMGYIREKMVDIAGTFSNRGGIIDIYPITEKKPIRLEFFDTEIESIRYFNPSSQRSEEPISGRLILTPAAELVLTQDTFTKGITNAQKEYQQTLAKLPPAPRRQLREKFAGALELMEQGVWQNGMDHFFYNFYQDDISLLEYLPERSNVILDEPEEIGKILTEIVEERFAYYYDLLEAGQILPSFAQNFFKAEPLYQKVNAQNYLGFSLLNGKSPFTFSSGSNFNARVIPGYVSQINLLISDMQLWHKQGYQQFFCASSQVRANKITSLLAENQISGYTVGIVPLTQGFQSVSGKLVVITERELLGQEARTKNRRLNRNQGQPLESFIDLKEGDLVVHANHGIGRFTGIERIKVAGVERDYIKIAYAGTDKLFVPLEQMDLVQKYIGNEGTSPKLYKLGGNQWQRVKNKVKASVQDMAEELLKLYAVRANAKGFAFSPDTSWQREFEDAFEFEETPGQIQAIEEIKADMENSRPMDRLLCGDVGYGKTEVAMRAAFKAVSDSKQVAVLVPTTILAEQHYKNFKERFKSYPIKIGVISRFVTSAKQKDLLEQVKNGEVDILIGTHRLLSKDITFKDIGLLVVDEEQRFGVAHKEKLKTWKENIDVLTLSATPIPRTLHMSLVGMRDMSVIDTPPEDRHPVQTYVVEYHPHLIKDAIERELARKGQVYFIHNKVMDIEKTADQVQALVPSARILVGHGKQTQRQLEKVMEDFVDCKADVLICTTIAEAGLDIPNVNTLIVNDADHFGLSQLYQLRGRVGRSHRQAFAYFTYGRDKVVNDVAKKRLTAIRDFTQLGSGFKIAMRDMEIRGAGNILGPEQHGHIAAVGFDLYCKLVAEEVDAALNQKPKTMEREAVQLDLGINAYIPDSYVADSEIKIEVYKRIAATPDAQSLSDLINEVTDRFGKMPQVVVNLFSLGEIKYLASKCLISGINHLGRKIRITFFPDHLLEGGNLVALAEKYGKILSFSQQKDFAINLDIGNYPEQQRLQELRDFLVGLEQLINPKN